METELNSNEGPVSENLKIFRHFYYAKMFNLVGCSNITKEFVNSLTAPDFICTYLDIKGSGFAELHFERNIPSAKPVEKPVEPTAKVVSLDTTENTVTEGPSEEPTDVQEEIKTESAPETPVKRGRGRPKKIKTA